MNARTTLALLVLFALVTAMVWRGAATPDDVGTESVRNSAPRYRIEGLDALRTDAQGQPLLRLTAAAADYYDDGAAKLSEIEAIGLSGGAAPWALKSPTGTVTAGEKRLLLHAPVTGTGQWRAGEGFTFAGSAVFVDDRKRQFYSSEALRIDSPTRSARARGFTAGFDGKTLKMTQPELSYVLED